MPGRGKGDMKPVGWLGRMQGMGGSGRAAPRGAPLRVGIRTKLPRLAASGQRSGGTAGSRAGQRARKPLSWLFSVHGACKRLPTEPSKRPCSACSGGRQHLGGSPRSNGLPCARGLPGAARSGVNPASPGACGGQH